MSHQIAGRRIFITGGAGFIGSTLIGRLVTENKITVYDDLRRDALSDKPYAKHPNLRMIKGDILDATTLSSAIVGSQIVIHCAAIAGIDTVIKRPTEDYACQHDRYSKCVGGGKVSFASGENG